jgi:hypothetical protein
VTGTATPPEVPGPPEDASSITIDGRSTFQALLRRAFERLAQVQPREVVLVDATFGDWPLGERAVVEQFEAWARSQRRLTLIAHGWDAFAARHPRWIAWRRTWSHVVDCRQVVDLEAAAVPTLLWAPGVGALRMTDPVRFRGRWTVEDPVASREVCGLIDALLQRSEPGFPVTTLGL